MTFDSILKKAHNKIISTLIFFINVNATCINYDSITYNHIVLPEKPLSIHVITVDPKNYTMSIEQANKGATGTELVSSIGKRTDATLAINAGTFRTGGPFLGNPTNLLIVNKKIISDPQLHRGCLGWSGSNAYIDYVESHWTLTIGGKKHSVNRVNQPREDDESILYNDYFLPETHSPQGCFDYAIEDNKIINICTNGSSPIPKNGYVYSTKNKIDEIPVGSPVEITFELIPYKNSSEKATHIWNNLDFIIGGNGFLLKDNTVLYDTKNEFRSGKRLPRIDDEEQQSVVHDENDQNWIIYARNPRTAVGIKNNGNLVFVVVDGRQACSRGLTLLELARFMQAQGCVDAINLDGGGASTLFFMGTVKNQPSGGTYDTLPAEERAVSEAIIIKPRLQ